MISHTFLDQRVFLKKVLAKLTLGLSDTGKQLTALIRGYTNKHHPVTLSNYADR